MPKGTKKIAKVATTTQAVFSNHIVGGKVDVILKSLFVCCGIKLDWGRKCTRGAWNIFLYQKWKRDQ